MPVPATATMSDPTPLIDVSAGTITTGTIANPVVEPLGLMNAGVDASSFPAMVESVLGAGMMGIGILIFSLLPLIMMFEFLSYCRVFQKAGIPLWAPLIPIYNIFIHFKVIKKSYWYILVMLIPIVNIVFGIKFTHCLSKKFGKGAGFTAGLILLPLIFIPILAWDNSEYEADELDSEPEDVAAPVQEVAIEPAVIDLTTVEPVVSAPVTPVSPVVEPTMPAPPVMPPQE